MKKTSSICSVLNFAWLFFCILSDTWLSAQNTLISNTINIYTPVTAIDTNVCPTIITVSSSAGFSINTKVLIMQMKGTAFDSSNISTFGNVTNIKSAGNFEISQITAVSGNSITLIGKLLRPYDVNSYVQLVSIPSYSNVTVTGSLTCLPWNGVVGGILIFEASGVTSLGADIDVSGKGFRGGTVTMNPDGGCGSGSLGYYYALNPGGASWTVGGAQKGEGIAVISATRQAGRGPLVNGGGGGNKHNTGGGGGGNYTLGGQGGNELWGCTINNSGGMGGKNLSTFYLNDKIFLGGGGGCGDANNGVGTVGERGGGIAIVITNTLHGNNFSIRANGYTVIPVAGAAADGAGGGGGGGAVWIKANVLGTAFTVQANGGTGGNQAPGSWCAGPGGGGGAGAIISNLGSLSTSTGLMLPGGPGTIIASSQACNLTTYGATAGQSNTLGVLFNRILPYTPTVSAAVNLSATTNNSSICTGNSVTLTASGANTYTWFPTGLTGSVIVVSPPGTIQYTVNGTNINGCTNTVAVTQSVNPSPTLSVFSSSPVICSGKTVTLTASGAQSYTWLPGGATSSVLVVTPAATTNYTVVGFGNSCTSSIVFVQSVNPTPTLNLSSVNFTICTSAPFNITALGATNYTWTPGGSSSSVLTTSINANTIFTVTGSHPTGCSSFATVTVTARPVPTIAVQSASISCATLGTATATPVGGIGPYFFTWYPMAQTGSVVTNLFPSTYTIVLVDLGTGCVITSAPNFTAPPLSGTITATPSVACFGSNSGTASIAIAFGSGAQNYTWTASNGIQFVATPTALAAGVNTVNIVDTLTKCAFTQTFFIYQPSALTLAIVPGNTVACMGTSLSFTSVGSGGTAPYSYTWSGKPPGPFYTANEPLAGNYIYSVQALDSNGCTIMANINVQFVNNPNVTVVSYSICPSETGMLFTSGASSYTWNTGFSGNPLLVSPAATTGYTVTGAASGCTAVATGTVFVKSVPSVSFSSNAPVCQGDSLHLFGLAAGTFSWTGPALFSSSIQNPLRFPALPSQSGNYTLKIIAANGCTAQVTNSVLINPSPPLVAGGGTACAGTPLYFSANFLSGGVYSWQGPSFSSSLQNPFIPGSNPSMNGHYTVTLTGAGGCKSSAVVSASVIVALQPLIGGDSAVCNGMPLQLKASQGNSFQWYGPGGYYSVAQNPLISPAGLNAAGTYSLVGTTATCTLMTQRTITIFSLPQAQAFSNGPVCANNIFQLSAAAAKGYTWSGPGGFFATVQNTQGIAFPSVEGIYSLSVIDTHSCIGRSTVFLQVKPLPVLATNGGTVCMGGELTLTVSGAATYTWSGPQNFTSNLPSPSIPIVTVSSSGIYSVSGTSTNGCIGNANVLVVPNNFALPVPVIDAPKKFCYDNLVILKGAGGVEYFWKGPSGFLSYGVEVNFLAKDSTQAGVYTLSVRNESYCVASTTVMVKLYAVPMGTLTADPNNRCVPYCSSLTLVEKGNTGPLTGRSYQWDKSVFSAVNYSCFLTPGNVVTKVFFSDSNNCVGSSSLVINAYEKPRANFDYSPQHPIAGVDRVYFYNSSSGGGVNGFEWRFLGTDSVESIEKNPTFIFQQSGSYPVVMIIKNNWGCSDTVIKPLLIGDEFGLYIPDAFSPNGDGLNDIFQPKGHGIRFYHMEIFDRWGEMIFRSDDPTNGWDGTYLAKRCPVDIYVWKVSVKDDSGKMRDLSGKVSVIR
jgi:gliding motility-associated-like protein